MKNNINLPILPERRLFIALSGIALIAGGLLIFTFAGTDSSRFFCNQSDSDNFHSKTDPIQLKSILHYATSRIVPQQSFSEISVSFESEPECAPAKSYIKGNDRCRLALTSLPNEVYDTEWDMIMVDAPRGYFAEAPGRMAAIYSATVMARNRKKSGVTHVFLHDVNRKVERDYANEFLCQKYRKHSVGRLWHFEIPPAGNVTGGNDGVWFC
ncbi:hypothetical protein E3N88_43945 [Mikania micrantha]|uniref:Uncharacterized protein n=1 Tax=Mikania micrantha TaxID=192012 RepID=A0A5N6LDM9_9ASTR|nr:hypothetical protein E3N88_43945 [Mikania micrantha]